MHSVTPIRDKKQLEAMKMHLKGKSLRDYLMFMVGISSALRISDILKLKVSDLWDGRKPVKYILLHEQKTGKMKRFPITLNLDKAIRDYIREYAPAQSAFVFHSRKGEMAISRQQAEKVLSDAWDYLGYNTEPFGTHSMRKTWGYWAWMGKIDLALIMEALNHSSLAATKKYLGITQNHLDDAYMSLNL